MGIVQRPLAAVIAAPGVTSPRKLAGRPVGVSGVPSDTAVLHSVVAGAGGRPSAVKTITIGFTRWPICSPDGSRRRRRSGTTRGSRCAGGARAFTSSGSISTARPPTPNSSWSRPRRLRAHPDLSKDVVRA